MHAATRSPFRSLVVAIFVLAASSALLVKAADESSGAVLACNVIRGNDKDNIRDGTDQCDDIATFKGSDISRAKDGSDTQHMGQGADGAVGNKDQDAIYGDDGVDGLAGGRGSDDINDTAQTDQDLQCGNEGDDSLNTADGDDNDAMVGGSGFDTLYDGSDSDFKEVGTDPNCDDTQGLFDTLLSLGALPNVDGAPGSSATESTSDPGYLFSDISVAQTGDPDQATLVFDWAWADGGFPGWRECVVTLTDASGASIVEEHRLFIGSAPSYSDDSVPVALDSTGATPTGGDIACLPGRLDDPAESYSFSDVRVLDHPESMPLTTVRQSVLVSFDAQWTSSGPGGVEVCFLRVLDSHGLQVAARSFDFMAADGHSNDVIVPLVAAEQFLRPPQSAELDCV